MNEIIEINMDNIMKIAWVLAVSTFALVTIIVLIIEGYDEDE